MRSGPSVTMGSRRRRLSLIHVSVILCALFTGVGLIILTLRSVDLSDGEDLSFNNNHTNGDDDVADNSRGSKGCATVEEMGDGSVRGEDSLRVRTIIQHHFAINGASRVRGLAPEEFCRHGYVIGKASEAGFGNEMYKILTAAALSVMLNRSLIIGQTRGKYPFGDYISYSDVSFTLKEVKHLWRKNGCLTKYGRHLVTRIDDFQKPAQTSVLCDNWMEWEQPIIWFQNTTDAVAAQFFLKNVNDEMRKAAANLFGLPKDVEHRPNVYGELMRVLISPSETVKEAVNWVLGDGDAPPDITLHMRMLMNKSLRAVNAALSCIRKASASMKSRSRPKIVLVSDTPSLINDVTPILNEFAEVIHFDYKLFKGNISRMAGSQGLGFRVKDWGPAPRWVAFVDFFLASRAKHAVVSGAHRRVGTTYAQLIAAMSAAHNLEENASTSTNFSFLSSFQSNLLSEGLGNQVGWGHVWNRFAGPLSCRGQSDQCAMTPLLSPAWWDGLWQSPLSRDIRRMQAYGIQLSGLYLYCGRKMYKNQLQELAQRSCFNLPFYACVREGPDYASRFKASVIKQLSLLSPQDAPSESLTARVLNESGIYKNLLQETNSQSRHEVPNVQNSEVRPKSSSCFHFNCKHWRHAFKGDSTNTKKQAEKNAAWSTLKTSTPNSSSTVKIQEVLFLPLDEHRRDEDEWLRGNSKAETTTLLNNNNNTTGNSSLLGSSSYRPINLLDHL